MLVPSHRKYIRLAIVVVLVVASMLVGMRLWFSYTCTEYRAASADAFDGRFHAKVVERNCGAFSGRSTSVIVVDQRWSWLPEYFRQAHVYTSNFAGEELAVSWIGEHTLVVEHPTGQYVEVYEQRTSWRDVSIIYRAAIR